jgi:hypothetical protein
MKILIILLLLLLGANTQAQNSSVPLTRSENHASFSAKGVTSIKPNANKPASSPGLHCHRNMPPMGENSEKPILAKGGRGVRRMPALGAEDKQQLPIGPNNSHNKLMLRR